MQVRRALVFFLCALMILATFYLSYSALNTLGQLETVERMRDHWQHPDEILQALEIQPGNTAVDLGSGAGYFTHKLSSVTRNGRVLAVDLRKLSLFFLRLRAFQKEESNIETIEGGPDDPHLPAASADAVLICNTYHEFAHPTVILSRVFSAMREGGRLVITDPSPLPAEPEHHVSLAQVALDLQGAGFDVVRQESVLLTDPTGDTWWLLVAKKPVGAARTL